MHSELKESPKNEVRNLNVVKWYMVMEKSLELQTDDGIAMIDTYFNETTTELTVHILDNDFMKAIQKLDGLLKNCDRGDLDVFCDEFITWG